MTGLIKFIQLESRIHNVINCCIIKIDSKYSDVLLSGRDNCSFVVHKMLTVKNKLKCCKIKKQKLFAL